MATPKSLKPISADEAQALIAKHLKAGTGAYEYPDNVGDFVYKTKQGMYLIRENFGGRYETGKVSN